MPGPYYSKTSTSNTTNLLGTLGGSVGSGILGAINSATTVTNDNVEVILQPKTPVIDVVNDFSWSASPRNHGAHKKVPVVYLTERKQMSNSLVASAIYYLNALATGTNASQGISFITTKLDSIIGGGAKDPGTTSVAGKSITSAFEAFKAKLGSLVGSGSDKALLRDLKSYAGIYFTEETGFQYALPYFNDHNFSVQNSWASTAQIQGPLGGAVATGMEIFDQAAAAINIMQPGTFIERPKYFQYPEEGKSITVTFPLLNTVIKSANRLPYQQNYELLWMLAYQNKPYRTSFSRILPSKIYTLTVPGQDFFPYCYISNMKVDFVGTRRNLPVTLPTNDTIDTVIPEAYRVSLTFTSLLADVANMMVNPQFATSNVRVRVNNA